MKKNVFMAFTSVLMAFVLTTVNCKKADNKTPGENEILILYKTFNPSQLSVKKGTTITFINKDNANHTITANTKSFDSGKIKSSESYSYTFINTGQYYFYCNYHSSNLQEQGVIIVQ